MRDAKRFVETLDRLLNIFKAVAVHANVASGYSSRLPGEEVEALADHLAQNGNVMGAGALRREFKRLQKSLFSNGPTRMSFGVCAPPTEEDRRQQFQTAVGRIVGLLEKEKSNLASEHLRRLRGLVASYDASKTRPAVADRGLGLILHSSHTCERLMVDLLRDLFTWEDEQRLDASAVRARFEELCAASEEAEGLTRKEERVLTLASGAVFRFLGRQWQSAHECLIHVARTMAEGFRSGASPTESLENHFLRKTEEDWPRLFAQLQRERSLAESGTEVSLQPVELVKAVQQVQPRDGIPPALDGKFPEGSPHEKKRRAAKKGAETKRANKEKKIREEKEKEARRQANQPKTPELKDWLAWALSTGKINIISADGSGGFDLGEGPGAVEALPERLRQKRDAPPPRAPRRRGGENCFRVVWLEEDRKLTQAEIAASLSFVLNESVRQQRVGEMIKKVDKWTAAGLHAPDYRQWVDDPKCRDFTYEEMTKFVDSDQQTWAGKRAGPALEPKEPTGEN